MMQLIKWKIAAVIESKAPVLHYALVALILPVTEIKTDFLLIPLPAIL